MRPERGPASLMVLAGAVLWGTTGTAQALGPASVPPLATGAGRIVVGGAGLLVLAWTLKALPSRALWRDQHVALLVSAVAVAGFQLGFFAGVARAGVAVGTAVAIGSAPAFTGVVARLAHGERPDRGWPLATTLAVAGCALLLLPAGSLRVDPVGVLLALGAGLSFAVYTVGGKALLDRGAEPIGVMGALFGVAALLLLPVLAAAGGAQLVEPQGLAMIAYLGLVGTVLSYVLFARGLAGVPASTAATLSLAEPLTAALLGLALLGERPGPLGVVGTGLVLAGLVVLAVRPRGRAATR